MFPGMLEHQFAKLFIVANMEKIKQDLDIKYANEETIANTIESFLLENKRLKKSVDQSKLIRDSKFYDEIINALRMAVMRGTALEMTADEYVDFLTKKLRKHPFVE
jgi:hypothetical protein